VVIVRQADEWEGSGLPPLPHGHLLIAPMSAEGEALGGLLCTRSSFCPPFGGNDPELAAVLARQAGREVTREAAIARAVGDVLAAERARPPTGGQRGGGGDQCP